MPRYYSIGAGESHVHIKGLFVVEVENLECRDPFVKKTAGGSFICALNCAPECSDYGCITPEDPTRCFTCKGSKVRNQLNKFNWTLWTFIWLIFRWEFFSEESFSYSAPIPRGFFFLGGGFLWNLQILWDFSRFSSRINCESHICFKHERTSYVILGAARTVSSFLVLI